MHNNMIFFIVKLKFYRTDLVTSFLISNCSSTRNISTLLLHFIPIRHLAWLNWCVWCAVERPARQQDLFLPSTPREVSEHPVHLVGERRISNEHLVSGEEHHRNRQHDHFPRQAG